MHNKFDYNAPARLFSFRSRWIINLLMIYNHPTHPSEDVDDPLKLPVIRFGLYRIITKYNKQSKGIFKTLLINNLGWALPPGHLRRCASLCIVACSGQYDDDREERDFSQTMDWARVASSSSSSSFLLMLQILLYILIERTMRRKNSLTFFNHHHQQRGDHHLERQPAVISAFITPVVLFLSVPKSVYVGWVKVQNQDWGMSCNLFGYLFL